MLDDGELIVRQEIVVLWVGMGEIHQTVFIPRQCDLGVAVFDIHAIGEHLVKSAVDGFFEGGFGESSHRILLISCRSDYSIINS